MKKIKRSVLRKVTLNAKSEILGHVASLDGLNASLLELLGESSELGVVVQLSTVGKTLSPGKDGGDGVGGGLLTSLVVTVVTSNGTVSSLSLDGLSIRADQNGGHETEGTEALGNGVRLNITVVVLASPDEATVGLHAVGNHIIDEAVLVPDTGSLILSLVVLLVDGGEDVLEATVVTLEDGVLGGQVQGPLLLESILEARVGKVADGLVSVVHAHNDTTRLLEVEDLVALLLTRGISVGHGNLTRARDNEISGAVLVTVSVTADDDGLGPAGDKARDVLAEDGLTENGTTENVTEGSVG